MAEELSEDRRKELDCVAAVMADPQGRAFVQRILVDRCSVFGSVVCQPHPALTMEQAMAYNGGRQDIGHWLMDEIAKVDSTGDLYMRMTNEAHNRHIIRKAKEKGRANDDADRDPRSNLSEHERDDE